MKINKLLMGWILAFLSCPLIYLFIYNSVEGLVYGVGVSIGGLIVTSFCGSILWAFTRLNKPEHLKPKSSSLFLKLYIASLLVALSSFYW